jgi:hypothetical protein
MTNNSKMCANGLMGYDIESGQMYTVRKACQSDRQQGSIYCQKCREEAGGYVRHRLQSPTQLKHFTNATLYTEIL